MKKTPITGLNKGIITINWLKTKTKLINFTKLIIKMSYKKYNISINFVTSNPGKVKEFKQILEPEIKVNHIEISYPELRSDSPEEIARC